MASPVKDLLIPNPPAESELAALSLKVQSVSMQVCPAGTYRPPPHLAMAVLPENVNDVKLNGSAGAERGTRSTAPPRR